MPELKINPNLFGMPHQFPTAVDPRLSDISNYFGRKFVENIGTEAPVCTFIPGVPKYLSNDGRKNAINSSVALLTENGYFGPSEEIKRGTFKDARLYDFKNDYTSYIKYVNVLCRAGAIFLNLGDYSGLYGTPLKVFNWANFRWNKTTAQGYNKKVKDATFGELMKENSDGLINPDISGVAINNHFVQFYIDADVSAGDDFSNSTKSSMFKGLLDTGSGVLKELSFMANSTDVGNDFGNFIESMGGSLTAGIEEILGGTNQIRIGNAFSRIINLGGEALKGHNTIMPDVYESSSYTKNYQITIHLKSPYGTKLGYYLNIFVPLMHLLGLAIPRQATANSYESPFIVKAYVDGIFSCNMGMVTSISINKVAESWTVEGLPTEVDVTLGLTDLYSGIQMTDSTSPLLFYNNSSLVEFLSVSCGLSLIAPNMQKKLELFTSNLTNVFRDIPKNIKTSLMERIDATIDRFAKLYN